jgi:hypothetical protein
MAMLSTAIHDLVTRESLGRIPALIPLPHGRVCNLNVACEPRGVKQRMSIATARQLGFRSDRRGWPGATPARLVRALQQAW